MWILPQESGQVRPKTFARICLQNLHYPKASCIRSQETLGGETGTLAERLWRVRMKFDWWEIVKRKIDPTVTNLILIAL